ncbi:hypothetical protein HT031_000239 [Scenedesmus sp. PABB004]|nr:hypothetical protein HT031_000239 [Scenedesmus sp. PABB004]
MEDSHYDEFGNYIGPALSDSDQEEEEPEAAAGPGPGAGGYDDDEDMDEAERGGGDAYAAGDDDDEGEPGTSIVLAEDKKYYPTAEETYGAGTEALVMEEDAQPLEVPIIAPVSAKKHERLLDAPLPAHATPEFMATLSGNPELIRNVAIVGALHHGKTSLMDMLVEQTHDVGALGVRPGGKPLRFTDTRLDEQARGISIKAMPMSLVLAGGSGKSYLVNLIDCPGHVNFNDEVTAAMRLADGVLLVVDVLEGVSIATERAIQQAVAEGLAITLLVSKMDRLITELKLPPGDAYHKIAFTIEEVNAVIRASGGGGGDASAPAANGAAANGAAPARASTPLLDPVAGNVAFASAAYGYSFTLRSFAALYRGVCGDAPGDVLVVDEFAARLWGDVWYYAEERVFRRKPPQLGAERSFVTFILEPLYKLTSAVIGEHPKTIERLLGEEFGIHLKSSAYGQDVRPLLKEVCARVFGPASGLVDMLVAHVPSAKAATPGKVARLYTGPQAEGSGQLLQFMHACSRTGPLVLHVAKLFPKNDASAFDAYGRIFSGTLRPGDEVRVLGEGFTPDDDEDSGDAVVSNVWLYQARYRVPMAKVTAGNLVLVEGWSRWPLAFQTRSVMKIATEPLQPSELPKMVEGLRKINKSYPLAVTRVEESGEHTLLGTGELYLDSIMKDLREMYADIEVKVADPVVAFCETVVETSSLKCFAETPNRKNKLTMIAEPLDKGLAEDIEGGKISITWPARKLGSYLVDNYEWDPLAARSVWAFGPAVDGPNVLLDDTLAGEVDKGLLGAVRDSIVQGFQWGSREGPLCDEPIRNVKFKITDALIADEPLHRGGGQVIPTARRVCYSAFLMATPRLMEPMYYVEIATPADCIAAIYNVLAKRRGHVTKDLPRPGTPIFTVRAYLPVVESFGFETDLRYHTQGQAFCQSLFDHWAVVPGDPLDRSVVLRPLEPAPIAGLAREFCVKTRRRKGMAEDVSVAKFFDDPMLLELAKADTELQAQMASTMADSMFGTFSEPGSLAVGDPHQQRKEAVGRFTGKQFSVVAPRSGRAPDAYIDKQVRSNALGDRYVDAWILDKRLSRAALRGQPVSSQPFFRRVGGAGSVSCGPGSGDGCLARPALDTDGSAAAARSAHPRRPADGRRNIYTAGPKTGGPGRPWRDMTLGEPPTHYADGYEGGRARERELRVAEKAALPGRAFVSAASPARAFAPDAQIYSRPPPQGGSGGTAGGRRAASAPRERAGPAPWRPSSPPKRGAPTCAPYAYVPDPVREAKFQAGRGGGAARPFRPASGSKARLSMWAPNPYATDPRPPPDIDFTIC